MAIIGTLLSRLVRRTFRRTFVADERGTTAIEFGILGIPFFALLAAILETSYVFLAGQILDTAVQDSARLIRTGQAQGAGFTIDTFRNAICDSLYGLFDCDELRINIQTVGTFTSASVGSPLPSECTPDDCEWAIPEVYAPGQGSSIVLVRVYYKWPTLVSLGGFTLQNTGANSRLLGSVRVFRNEPF